MSMHVILILNDQVEFTVVINLIVQLSSTRCVYKCLPCFLLQNISGNLDGKMNSNSDTRIAGTPSFTYLQ